MNKMIDNQNLVVENQKENSITFYTNAASIIPNYYDFQFVFTNQSLEEAKIPKVIRKELCRVFMSPQHAKVLSTLLTENVKKYEQRFGEIIVPKEIFASIEEVK